MLYVQMYGTNKFVSNGEKKGKLYQYAQRTKDYKGL